MNNCATINICAYIRLTVFKCPFFANTQTVTGNAKRPHIPTVRKVIRGLSADNFGLDFDPNSKVGASLQLLSGRQFIADF